MNSAHLRNSERVQRVITYVDSQPGEFPEESKAASLCSQLKQEQAKLGELDVVRSSSMSKRRQATAARQTAHKLLLTLLGRVIDTAEVAAAERADVKGMFGRPQRNASDQTLVADARSIAEKAATLVGLFTENGLPATFVNDMRSYADSIEHAMQNQTEAVGESVRANNEIAEVIRRMNGLVERLDVIVRNKYRDDPAKLAAWESARRLERPPRSNRNSGNNAPPPAPQQ
jgi:hypothetical protein